MGLFNRKSAPTREVEKLKSRLASLREQAASLEGEIETKRQVLESVLIEGRDEDAIRTAETALADSERRHVAVSSATVKLTAQIATAEAEIAAAADRARREAEAGRIDEALKSTTTAATALRDAADNFLKEIEPIASLNWSARQWATLIATVSHELPTGTDLIASETSALISNILDGSSAIQNLPAKAETKALPIETPVRRIVTLASMRWTANGKLHSAAKHNQAELPIDLADKAVALRWALELNDPQARKISSGYTMPPPPHDADVDLDDPDLQPRKPTFGRDRIQEGFVEFRPRRAVG
ncbi:MAG: hypothetical protein R3D82_16030 [Xanthobacteraceae bacterium]